MRCTKVLGIFNLSRDMMVVENGMVPIIGNINKTAATAFTDIKEACFIPSYEIRRKWNLTISFPGTDRGMITRKKEMKKRTHLKCLKTKEKGILEISTKRRERDRPKRAKGKLDMRTMEKMRPVIQISFNLGSQLCKGEWR